MSKKFLFTFAVLMLSVGISLMLTGCRGNSEDTRDRINSPIATLVDEDSISWSAIANARGYRVYVGEQTTIVEDTTFDISDLAVGRHSIRVRALVSEDLSVTHQDSVQSSALVIDVDQHPVPTELRIENTDSWGPVFFWDGATGGQNIFVYNEDDKQVISLQPSLSNTSFGLRGLMDDNRLFLPSGTYRMYIETIRSRAGNIVTRASSRSEPLEFEIYNLPAPTLSVSGRYLTWTTSERAKSHDVRKTDGSRWTRIDEGATSLDLLSLSLDTFKNGANEFMVQAMPTPGSAEWLLTIGKVPVLTRASAQSSPASIQANVTTLATPQNAGFHTGFAADGMFSWDTVQGALHYQIFISNTTGTSFTVTVPTTQFSFSTFMDQIRTTTWWWETFAGDAQITVAARPCNTNSWHGTMGLSGGQINIVRTSEHSTPIRLRGVREEQVSNVRVVGNEIHWDAPAISDNGFLVVNFHADGQVAGSSASIPDGTNHHVIPTSDFTTVYMRMRVVTLGGRMWEDDVYIFSIASEMSRMISSMAHVQERPGSMSFNQTTRVIGWDNVSTATGYQVRVSWSGVNGGEEIFTLTPGTTSLDISHLTFTVSGAGSTLVNIRIVSLGTGDPEYINGTYTRTLNSRESLITLMVTSEGETIVYPFS